MPFRSEAQHRKFRVLLRQGKITQAQFDEWMAETKKKHGEKHPIKALPERVKKASYQKDVPPPAKDEAEGKSVVNLPTSLSETDKINDNAVSGNTSHFLRGFRKTAGGPGSGVSFCNTDAIDFLETSPIISIGYRQKFMDLHKPTSKNTEIEVAKIKYKGQEKMVPKKVVKMMKIWEDVKDKPIDVIKDSEGNYHILDGHHRALAAIFQKEKTIKANIYRVPKELK